MPALVDLSVLVKHVSAASQAPAGDVASLFGAVCEQVAERLLVGTGVLLPGLGSFVPGPAFLLDPGLGGLVLSGERGGTPTPGARVAPLNFAAVAARARVARPASTSLVRALLAFIAGQLRGHANISLDFGVGVLSHGNGMPCTFTFSDAFLARSGRVPPPLRGSRLAPGHPSATHGEPYASFSSNSDVLSPDCALLAAACRAGDTGRTGVVPRVTVEALLRGPCAAAMTAVDALSLLRLLDDSTDAMDGGVRYVELAAALTAYTRHAQLPPPPPPRSRVPQAAISASPQRTPTRTPPAANMQEGAPALPSTPVPAPNDAFLSRRGVDAYNSVLRASSRALLASTGGVAPKVTATVPLLASSGLGRATSNAAAATPAAQPHARQSAAVVAPPRGSLAAIKRAEVAADAARLRELHLMLEQEAKQAAAAKVEKQRALRALLDEQVASRAASRAATPFIATADW